MTSFQNREVKETELWTSQPNLNFREILKQIMKQTVLSA